MKHLFSLLCLTALLAAPRAQAQTGAQVTFSQHIAPLVYQHCTPCHRTGEVAPFPLTTYAEVASHAQTIKYVTGTKYMPPWKPDANYRHYLDENTLTTTEIQQIRDWVDNGMPQGNAAQTPPVPTFPSGSQLGTPDLVVPMRQAFTHQGNGQDMYRIFVLPVNLPADRNIAAIEFRAGNKRIVHHVIIGMDTTQQAQALDAADPGYGYTRFGGFGFSPVEEVFGAWVPGMQARFYPTGMGKKLYRRASLLLQIHYGPNFVTQKDSSVVNIFFARQPVTRFVQTLPAISPSVLTNGPFVIPANQTKTFRAQLTVPADVTVLSVSPHAHLLSKSWKVWAVKPNGDTIRLVKINDWDFRWQGTYRFTGLQRIPFGSRLMAEATYDNTANNPRNPNNPPQQVTWGESTTAEMLLTYFELLPYQPGDESIVLSSLPGVATTPGTVQMAVFPNPASSGGAAISFQLAKPGPVSVALVDATGRVVRTLAREKAYPAGPQQLPLPLEGVAAGIYFVKLESNEGTRNEKLVVK
ncbi:T9SS type A sorting domain-containing protein [Hymenobacter armeniacus]|uniref:T9SS type A sorting domain-containing protein n=1 Tax=Hymenobacter armeniacus TaxID=2771358 RepID=A0ABR8JSK6_9BACT|nr:T9SS type A sorting domain-containing protein [Hymenobacter armeniacus]MBD2721758.1 T9SS type A sorting domain-containing protein [Hymenobacter armeniacus]